MRHGEQFPICWPRDGQEESRIFGCFNLVLDRSAKGQKIPGAQFINLALCVVSYVALQYLHGACAIDMMFLHLGGSFHADQNNPKILLLIERSGMYARRPGLALLGFGHFA